MMSSLQGTDTLGKGTFSSENGGIIKAYHNRIEQADSLIYANTNHGTTSGNETSFDAYEASKRGEIVPATYKTMAGNTSYNNFDTLKDLGANQADIDDVTAVEGIVTKDAGRMNQGDFTWKFNNETDDTSYGLNSELMSKIRNYKTQLISVGVK